MNLKSIFENLDDAVEAVVKGMGSRRKNTTFGSKKPKVF